MMQSITRNGVDRSEYLSDMEDVNLLSGEQVCKVRIVILSFFLFSVTNLLTINN